MEARDADLNGTKNSKVEYQLIGDLSVNFTVNATTGVIKPMQAFDFENLEGEIVGNAKMLSLFVRGRDMGTPSLFSDSSLVIYVEDVNDNAPNFLQTFYEKFVPENLPSETSILKVEAIDLDGSYPNNHVVYRIQEGASDKFAIAAETGIISIARGASLDPDLTQPRTTRYSLKVLALDGASTQLQAEVTVNITVVDINNKSPVFLDPGTAIIQENTPVGTIVTRLRATDLDPTAVLRFKVDPSSCEAKTENGILPKISLQDCLAYFNLGETDGVVTTAKQLDREIVDSIRLGLIVEDVASETGPQIATAKLTIAIEDVNDNNPKFRKPFYKFTVPENSKSGTLIGTIIADDLDVNKTVSYVIEASAFIKKMIHLDDLNGDMFVLSKIDHEVHKWLNFSVKAIDSGFPARSSRVEVYLQVLDENDNNPYFLPEPSLLMIPEDIMVGQEITILEAKDADSGEYGKITYLLDRLSSGGKFLLDAETGVLKVAEPLDREAKSSYLLLVEAWDNYHFGFNNGESRNAFKHLK